jgi:hypothetical protein
MRYVIIYHFQKFLNQSTEIGSYFIINRDNNRPFPEGREYLTG